MGWIGGPVQVWHEQDHCVHLILQHANYEDIHGNSSPSDMGPQLLRQCQKVHRLSKFLGIDFHSVVSAVRAAFSWQARGGEET